MMQLPLAPVVLCGDRVRLEPLSASHFSELEAAGADEAIWRWLPSAHCAPGSMARFIDDALRLQGLGLALPFATVDLLTGRAVGSTRYHGIEVRHRRLEIGFTWLSLASQRTYVNTESKFLLLQHAFETLDYRRVELKVDSENTKSRTAVLRLGAREEGYFRKHMLYPEGRNRDSVYYSILDDEWPAVKTILQEKLRWREKH